MKAIRVARTGGPEVMELADVELAPPAAGEARVRHTAIGVNFIDVYFRTGLYTPPSLPFVPGMEGAGVVEAIGANVSEVAVGDRVAYASRPLGAYAEARNMPAHRLVKLPREVDDETAAAAMLKGMTAQVLLRRAIRVEKGQTILVHAAAGGVGSIVCQWGHHLGARVIGTVGNDEKAAQAREDGCDHPIVYTRENFVERVRAITDGAGVHVVYDSVGKDTFQGSIECLASRGMVVSFGQSSGLVPPFDLLALSPKSAFLTRASMPEYTQTREELVQTATELFEVMKRGVVRVRTGKRFALQDAAKAHRELEGRRTVGSTILLPNA
jgi:NADPH2:quinone reductase